MLNRCSISKKIRNSLDEISSIKGAEDINIYNKSFIISPHPSELLEFNKNGKKNKGLEQTSVDLRLSNWFSVDRKHRAHILDAYELKNEIPNENKYSKMIYVKHGEKFCIKPGEFVLSSTLEWIKLPIDVAGYVVGRSSWGRYGLIIATATGVHPLFNGCLTLEIANIGSTDILLIPGSRICQIFFHEVADGLATSYDTKRSGHNGYRKPSRKGVLLDPLARKMASKHHIRGDTHE